MAGAIVTFLLLVGIVAFDAWPQAAGLFADDEASVDADAVVSQPAAAATAALLPATDLVAAVPAGLVPGGRGGAVDDGGGIDRGSGGGNGIGEAPGTTLPVSGGGGGSGGGGSSSGGGGGGSGGGGGGSGLVQDTVETVNNTVTGLGNAVDNTLKDVDDTLNKTLNGLTSTLTGLAK